MLLNDIQILFDFELKQQNGQASIIKREINVRAYWLLKKVASSLLKM